MKGKSELVKQIKKKMGKKDESSLQVANVVLQFDKSSEQFQFNTHTAHLN